jgi:predicted metal-dependent RNase
MISDPKNLLAIVGWQAPETPGRKLQEGAKIIDIPIEYNIKGNIITEIITMPVAMKVKKYNVFSSHADGCEIMTWFSRFNAVGKVFVIHGEKETTIRLADRITKYLKIAAMSPATGYKETLLFNMNNIKPSKRADMCKGMGQKIVNEEQTDQ